MPFEYLSISQFAGMAGSYDGRDLPPEVAEFCLNVDLATLPGILRGMKTDRTVVALAGRAFTLLGDGTEAVYLDETTGTIKHLTGLPNPGTPAVLSGTFVSVGVPSAVSDGRAVHVGMGSTSLSVPKWVGYVKHGQFGQPAPNAVVAADAELRAGVPQEEVDVLIGSTVNHPIEEGEAPLKSGYTYFYGVSYIYDGHQESPVVDLDSSLSVQIASHISGFKSAQLKLCVKKGSISPRVTGINVYRAETPSQGALVRMSNWMLVKSVSLMDGDLWEPESSYYGSGYWEHSFDDVGEVGQSYYHRTDIDETLEHMQVHYRVSCAVDGFHFVTDVWHKDMKKVEGLVLRSKPYRFDTFDWANDYLYLPTTPNALVPFAGRLYAFCDGITYIINPATFSLEGEFQGVGCFSKESCIETPRGLFFCDKKNIYHLEHGGVPVPIGLSVVTNERDPSYGYETNTNSSGNPAVCLYDARQDILVVLFRSNGAVRGLCYQVERQAWTGLSSVLAAWTGDLGGGFTGIGGELFVSIGGQLYELFGGSDRRAWKWYSGRLHDDGRYVTYYEIRLTAEGTPTPRPNVYWIENTGAWQTPSPWTDLDAFTFKAPLNTDAVTPWKKVQELRLRLEGTGTQFVRSLTLKRRKLGR